MNGAIIYASKYGSTAQYAQWIGEATGLPVFNIEGAPRPESFDFLVLGSPVIYYGFLIENWVSEHLGALEERPVVFFSVSGAGPGPKLDRWLRESLPKSFVEHMHHVGLRGRQDPKDLTLYDRTMLIIAGLKNPDRKAGREELKGFDYMDQGSIGPIVEMVRRLQAREVA